MNATLMPRDHFRDFNTSALIIKIVQLHDATSPGMLARAGHRRVLAQWRLSEGLVG